MSIKIRNITDFDSFILEEEERIKNPKLTEGIPEHTHGAIRRYVDHKIPPGSFLGAMLIGDLHGTMCCADSINIRFIKEIYHYLRWHVPSNCWGNIEAVDNWLKKGEE